jgi:small subunit ribosomal protein S16
MAVKIRMRQQGRKNRQTFRLVVTDVRNPRDGKYVETLGSYDPNRKDNNLTVDAERLQHWLDLGAVLSDKAESLVKSAAPEVIKGLQEKRSAARVKQAAARRKKKPTPVKVAAPVVAEEKAPKKAKAAPKKKAKVKDES